MNEASLQFVREVGLVYACVLMPPRGLPWAEMSKRSVSSREISGPSRTESSEDFTIDPLVTIEDEESDSESDGSYYPGLDSEPDTEEEETSSEAAGELGSGAEENSEASSSQESELEDEPQKGVEEREEEERVEAERAWREAEETDTSDEEEIRNTVGNVPLEWYEDYPHIGYDLDGRRVYKPVKGDELDEFLAKMEDPSYWRTVQNKFTGKDVVLSDQQLDMIQRIQKAEYPDTNYNPYEPYVDHFTHDKMLHPLSDIPKPKSSFIPSKWERRKIVKLVHAIKMGWIKPRARPEKPKFYILWSDNEQADRAKHRMHIPAPKMKLPGHEESYNPPPEYLPTQEEAKEWHEMEPEDRPKNFLPHKYGSLREVPAYPNFIQERFERCLDLYLCPRQRRMRVQVDPEDLIPKLPKPKDLYPFPTTETIVYEGHTALVRCVSVEPLGQWIASGSDDETVRMWEVTTGRCVRTLRLSGRPLSLAFCPNGSLTLLAAAVGNSVHLINHGLGDKLLVSMTDTTLSNFTESQPDSAPHAVAWQLATEEDQGRGFRLCIRHSKIVNQVVWHRKGDYFATVLSDAAGSAVFIHQLSKRRSQNPFKKLKGLIQKVMFHPLRPFFFVATQVYVKVYNLAKQELTRKLHSGVKWISSIDIHPHGDNLIIGSYDKRLCWFDMDLSNKPYRVIRHHKQAIRQVCYHSCYPLFASCSDDAAVIIGHGMVYNDLMQNPLIVPVKVLRGHSVVNSLGILDCQFHPTQPWVFTAGADSTLRLYT